MHCWPGLGSSTLEGIQQPLEDFLVLRRQIFKRRLRQSSIDLLCARVPSQNAQMFPNRLRISANNRTAKPRRRTELLIVRQSLPENRHHSPRRLSPRNPGRLRHALSRCEQSSQQRRRKRPPCVIRRLIRLAYVESPPAEIAHNLPHDPHRNGIALDRKWNPTKRRIRSANKRHQRMHRRNASPSCSQGIQFIAGERSARMQRNSPLPAPIASSLSRGGPNRRIRHAKPSHIGCTLANIPPHPLRHSSRPTR